MKRIPRSFPVTRSRRQPAELRAADGTVAAPPAGDAAATGFGPQDQALLDRLRSELDLRLQRGLRSEAAGIELAIRVICEVGRGRNDPANDRHR